MRHNRFLQAAAALWALAVLTAAMLPGSGSLARYAASAEGAASARVAKWDAFDRIDPGVDDTVTLYFVPGASGQTATLTLINKSEVTARYVLEPNVDTWDQTAYPAKQDFLNALDIRASASCGALEDPLLASDGVDRYYGPCGECAGNSYDPTDSIVLGYADGAPTVAHLDVTIPAVAFKGLRIDAFAVQVD